MPIFKKRNDDVLDLTDMQRRGLLQKSAEIERQFSQNKDSSGYFDFTGGPSSSSTSNAGSPSPAPASSGGSQFDFLDALASTNGNSSSSPAKQAASTADSLEVQGLKNKIDDLEYKLQVLEDKIARLES